MMRHTALRCAARASPRIAAGSLRSFSALPQWATVDPYTMSGDSPAVCHNLVQGEWKSAAATTTVIDPLTGEKFITIPDTSSAELGPFIDSMKSCPKTGLHNPVKNVERYVMLGNCSLAPALRRHADTCHPRHPPHHPTDISGQQPGAGSQAARVAAMAVSVPSSVRARSAALSTSAAPAGEVCNKTAIALRDPATAEFFAKLIQRVCVR